MADDIVLRVLGLVEVLAGGELKRSGSPQQRVVLAMLALRAGQVIPVADLVDAVWDTAPPHSAAGSLQALISGARQALAGSGGRLERCGEGYRLRIDASGVDVHRFRSLATAGRAAADGRAAAAAFDRALALWRGPALAGLPGTPAVQAARVTLDEERLSVTADRIAGLLACGMEHVAAAELPGLLAVHPLAERLAGMLMVARYRSGQRAGALQVFRDIRGRLAAELGIEPGPQLQALHRRILAGDPELGGGAETGAGGTFPRVVPRQLPAAAPHFAGRAGELKALGELVGHPAAADGHGVIWVIAGPAGVGKTTLAVHWAHGVADRFPDGQLYVNLRGFGPSGRPVLPTRAIRGMLRALQLPSEMIPESLDAQAALYRSVLAGKRLLVLLDNAADARQVRPLLPGSASCPVLVTSRSQLTGLVAAEGARLISLGVLPEADSCELLAGRLGMQRVMAEPGAASELAGLCAGLPLALAIAAARAAARPGLPLAALAAELRGVDGERWLDARGVKGEARPDALGGAGAAARLGGAGAAARLDALCTGDARSSVREVFSWSFRQLSESAARMFRLLGSHPGPDISAPAAASLAGIGVPQARRALAELTGAHLVAEPAVGRFGFHDLLRAYAGELGRAQDTAAERGAAVHRLLDHYVVSATAAYPLLYPAREPLAVRLPQPGTEPERPATRAQARAWFAAEHQVLVAAAAQAAAAGFDTHAWQLAAALSEFLDRQGHWHDLAVIHQAALAAATRCGDRCGQAHAHHGLAMACLRFGRYDEGRRHLRQAIEAFRELGDRARQARSRIFLGTAFGEQGRCAAARRHTGRALRVYRHLGHAAGQAHALTNLGWHSATLGHYQAALSCCQRALVLHREVGNALGEAHTWDYLGYTHGHLGEHRDSITCYRRALGLLGEVGDRSEQAGVLTRLGDAHRALGDRPAARDAWRQARAVLDDLRHRNAGQVVWRLDGPAAGR